LLLLLLLLLLIVMTVRSRTQLQARDTEFPPFSVDDESIIQNLADEFAVIFDSCNLQTRLLYNKVGAIDLKSSLQL
jgi:hypothetical protein